MCHSTNRRTSSRACRHVPPIPCWLAHACCCNLSSWLPVLTSSCAVASFATFQPLMSVSVQAVRSFLARVKQDLGLDVYSFSVFHVFFEQYLTIGHDALVMLTIATIAVTAIVYIFTSSFWACAMICSVLIMILVSLLFFISLAETCMSLVLLMNCAACAFRSFTEFHCESAKHDGLASTLVSMCMPGMSCLFAPWQ